MKKKAIIISVSTLCCVIVGLAIGLPVYYSNLKKDSKPDSRILNLGLGYVTSLVLPTYRVWVNDICEYQGKGEYLLKQELVNIADVSKAKVNVSISKKDYSSFDLSADEDSVSELNKRYFYYDEIYDGAEISLDDKGGENGIKKYSYVYVSLRDPIKASELADKYLSKYPRICFAAVQTKEKGHFPSLGINTSPITLFGDSTNEYLYSDTAFKKALNYFGISASVLAARSEGYDPSTNTFPTADITEHKNVAQAYLYVFNEILSVFSNRSNIGFTNSILKTDVFGQIDLVGYRDTVYYSFDNSSFDPMIVGLVMANATYSDIKGINDDPELKAVKFFD